MKMDSSLRPALIRLEPSNVSPWGDVSGLLKLVVIVLVTPLWMKIESALDASELMRLEPSNVSPRGCVTGLLKLVVIVDVIPE